MTGKRNPPDVTGRNITALKKRLDALAERLEKAEQQIDALQTIVTISLVCLCCGVVNVKTVNM